MASEILEKSGEHANAVAAKLEADVYLYSASITRQAATSFCNQVHSIANKRKNAVLVLTTYGGDPDAAFIVMRSLKRCYEKVFVFVFGVCKSAGTLMTIAATEIVMSDCAELGPLDIQMGKDDEIFKRSSGLDINESIKYLRNLAADLFYKEFIRLKSLGTLTTKTAAEIAQSLATGIINPIAAQIDPLKIGEAERSMRIARDYGRLLNPNFDKLESLVTSYPAHGFVIDREQANDIFGNVRSLDGAEVALESALGQIAREPSDIIEFLTPQATEVPDKTNKLDGKPSNNEEPPKQNEHANSNGETHQPTEAPVALRG